VSDQRLRQLERRRGTDDEAAWLVERLRAGSLTRERLDLAAWCGHEPAIRAGGTPGPDDPDAWVRGLEVFSPALAVWSLAEVEVLELEEEAGADRLERLRLGARDAFLRDEGLGFARQETASSLRPGVLEQRVVFALHQLLRDARRADPVDPDIQRALEGVRPRFPYLDPGTWRYGWSERAPLGGWGHRLKYERARGGSSEHLVQACEGWTPPEDAPRVPGLVIVGNLWLEEQHAPVLATIREAAIAWALR
jgi:hypothetical protein